MIDKILPLLSTFIPPALAVKGISKVDPRLGKFLTTALSAGYGTDMALNFLRSQFEAPGERDEKERLERGAARGTLRPDELASREQLRQSEQIPNLLQKGAAIATGGIAGGLSNAISQKEEAQPIQESQSGNIKQARNAPPLTREQALMQRNEMQKKKKLFDQLKQEFEGAYPEPQQQRSSGDDELLAAMERILKM